MNHFQQNKTKTSRDFNSQLVRQLSLNKAEKNLISSVYSEMLNIFHAITTHVVRRINANRVGVHVGHSHTISRH